MENKDYSIFDAPSEHNDKNTEDKKTRKRTVTLVSGILLAAIIFLSAFLIVRFMPEQKIKRKNRTSLNPSKSSKLHRKILIK